MSVTRREFREKLAGVAELLRRQIAAAVDGFPVDPKLAAARRAQVLSLENGYRFFAKTYFPHYTSAAPSMMHEWLFDELPKRVQETGLRAALAAPRGEAKSTMVTQIFVLWCIITRRTHYAVIVMDTYEQAAEMLEAIKAELEVNLRLQMDFPEHCGEGRRWREGEAVTRSEIKVKAFGSGKKMRGLRHGPHRPDLVIGDDLENDENVRSPEQRDKLERWLRRTVLSLGKADNSMNVIVIGTILHFDSLLSRLMRDKLWLRKAFKAIMQWPEATDLWDEWESILLNDGAEAALAFYAKRKGEMDRGAVVSWASMRSLYSLMVKRATDGHDAFDSEQQNDPSAGDAAPLAGSLRLFHSLETQPHWLWFGAVDPSLGKNGGRAARGDPSAILVGAFDRVARKLRVFHASIKRRVPDRIIEDVIAAQRTYQCALWGGEAVQFQEFLRTEVLKRSIDAQVPVPMAPIIPIADKALRIESLQPWMAQSHIEIHASCVTLIEQIKHWPMGDHDDGPDALEMLWKLATTASVSGAYHGAKDVSRMDGSRTSDTEEMANWRD